ncbi:MAG: STAS domain-containing protein [Deferribacteres bacterium]|nr:STAS domain-containing protein [candidate division KSB1 bacterium]MCB9503344.1 STAS domain-containing protein [Deferribacteres bacterium]
MEGINISVSRVGARRDIALLKVRGYLDTQTCGTMHNEMTKILQDGFFHLIVDMGTVNYVSSAGWGVFVSEIKNIREKGGDLKIVQMLPEVYDVFEMLEFNRILECYDTIEESINDFDLSIGLDITKSISRSYRESAGDQAVAHAVVKPPVVERPKIPPRIKGRSGYVKPKADPQMLPLSEKVRALIIEDPTRDAWRIMKDLRTPEYGNTRVGLIKIYKLLKKLSLDTKEKRYRFYRSR